LTSPDGILARPAGIAGQAANPDLPVVRITNVSLGNSPRYARRRRAALLGAGVVVGISTALVALGIAQLAAWVFNAPIGAPVDAVGELAINHSPPWLKNWAISEFGSNDKTVLVWGIRFVLIIFAAIVGVVAVRRLWQGMVGLAVFTAIGVYAALSQPSATVGDIWPTLVGGAVGALALRYLCHLADHSLQAAAEQAGAGPPPGTKGPARAAQDGEQPGQQAAGVPPPWFPERDVPKYPVASPERRKFLLASTGAAGAAVITSIAGSWLAHNRIVSDAETSLRLPKPAVPASPLPAGSSLRVPGISPFITPNANFYRVDTAIILPAILPASWQLRVHGMVRRELVLSFDELIKRPLIEDYITLCCVSNPVGGPYIGNAKWLGASLRSLLLEAGIKPGADELLCTSSDGFTSGTPVKTAMDGRDALLAVAMNDTALPIEHGFPVRLVIPGLYGYVSACKWIVDIEVTTYAASPAYWSVRGWSAEGPIKTESRIDVPTGASPVKAGQRTAIAGEAWAQHKGIEAVEVRIGNGPWHEAQLAAVPDIDTWRQWVYYWDTDVPAGTYLIEARATDRTGYTQTAVQASTEPNGATGYPSVAVTVTT
jgi:DMSO/TMAO reductase YedYZ molybdopterin-dependent catalytic subunit